MHDVAHEFQDCAQSATRMEIGELACRESPAFEQCYGERIAERLLYERRCGGRKVVRTGLARLRQQHSDVGGFGERAFRARRKPR
jgi:hypothetical protein